MDIPIRRRGKIVAAVIAAPISKIVLGSPLTRPIYCANPAKSTKTATTNVIMRTATNNMDRTLNSRRFIVDCVTAISFGMDMPIHLYLGALKTLL